ncbi:MAG: ABC transporter permease [Hyphomicrobiaceae bacterium]
MSAGVVGRGRRTAVIGLLAPVTVLLGIFFLIPLGIMLVYSFLEPGLYGGVVWSFFPWNYGRVIGWPIGGGEEFDPIYLTIFWRSLKLALSTVVVSLVICYPVAFWIARLKGWRKNAVLFAATLPFFSNVLVLIYAWLLILRPTGFVNTLLVAAGLIDQPLNLIFSEFSVLVGLVFFLVPFMLLPIYANVERLDWALVQASADLGATPIQTFRRVILPLTLPGIVGGSIIVFIPALGNFVVAQLLGGAKVQMVGNLIEQQFLKARNWPFGATLAMLMMVVVLALVLVYVTRTAERNDAAKAVG